MPTAHRRLALTLTPDTLAAAATLGRDLSPDPDRARGDASMAVTGALAEYAAAIDRAARELDPVLTRAEWNAVADVMNGCADLYDYVGPQMSPLVMVTANLQDTPGIGEKWGIDTADLCRRLAALTPTHGYAILAAVRWFWTHLQIDHGRDEWWTPAFRRTAS